MRQFIFLILFETVANIEAVKPRNVNLALETVFIFDSKGDVDFVNALQKSLKYLKAGIIRYNAKNDQGNDRIENHSKDQRSIFTNFLTETMTILRAYEDDDLKRFINVLDDEIKVWQRHKEFHEITDKLGFRRIIDSSLKYLKESPIADIRRKLNTLPDQLHVASRDGSSGFIASFLNNLYKKESQANLMNILNNLKLYRSRSRRNNIVDLKRIIRNGIVAIITPLLELSTDTNTFRHKFTADTDVSDDTNANDLHKHGKSKKSKLTRKKTRVSHEVEDEIFDYIEHRKKIIEKHLTRKGFESKEKMEIKPKRFTSINHSPTRANRGVRAKKNKNVKMKRKSFSREIDSDKKKNGRQPKVSVNKSTDADDNVEERGPVLIKLGIDDDSELRSVERYVFSTSKQGGRQRKTTRRKQTPKKLNYDIKTTKKYRKALRSSILPAEGLSIEHFGSLFGRDFYRSYSNNDTSIQTKLNTAMPDVTNDLAPATNGIITSSEETRRNDNLSMENKKYILENFVKTKNISRSIEEKKPTEIVDEKHDVINESIKIKGKIVIEEPAIITAFKETEVTSSKPINRATTQENLNVTIATKYFNILPIKPTVLLSHPDMDAIDKTEINTPRTSTAYQTKVASAQSTNTSNDEAIIKSKYIKTNEDGLENEIEGIMDKYNATTVPVEIQNFLKEVQTNNNDNIKIKEQMQADMAKLFAPPTTKSTVTELFTDPFNDIDEAADIL